MPEEIKSIFLMGAFIVFMSIFYKRLLNVSAYTAKMRAAIRLACMGIISFLLATIALTVLGGETEHRAVGWVLVAIMLIAAVCGGIGVILANIFIFTGQSKESGAR
jgi:cytochrome b